MMNRLCRGCLSCRSRVIALVAVLVFSLQSLNMYSSNKSPIAKAVPSYSLPIAEGQVTWIDPPGTFLERVTAYNEALSQLRSQLLQSATTRVLNESKVEFIDQIKNTSLITLALRRALVTGRDGVYACEQDRTNLLVQKYHALGCSPPYMEHINKLRHVNQNLTLFHCSEDYSNSGKTQCLQPSDFYPKAELLQPLRRGTELPQHFVNKHPQYVLYINVAQHAVVDQSGYLYTNSLKIAPLSCKHNYSSGSPEDYSGAPLYSEVLVISQPWADAYFHGTVESIPRIAPYLQFLQQNTNIKVHAGQTDSFTARLLNMMGIPASRLITGTVRALIAYLPQSTDCGYASIPLVQLTSHHYRQYLDRTSPDLPRRNLVMIHRNFRRPLTGYMKKETAVKALAKTHNLTFVRFSDDPLPSFEEQVQIFRQAAVVVGPHGAGLSNLIFSQPGTLVIEGSNSPSKLILCYPRLSHVLGHRHHSIPSMEPWTGEVNITTQVFVTVVRKYLKLLF